MKHTTLKKLHDKKSVVSKKEITHDEKKCKHGVVKKFCFNCKFREFMGNEIIMIDKHHYVKLRGLEKKIKKEINLAVQQERERLISFIETTIPPFNAKSSNALKHVYQNEGYGYAQDEIIKAINKKEL